MNTDKKMKILRVLLIRVHPCSSVAKLVFFGCGSGPQLGQFAGEETQSFTGGALAFQGE